MLFIVDLSCNVRYHVSYYQVCAIYTWYLSFKPLPTNITCLTLICCKYRGRVKSFWIYLERETSGLYQARLLNLATTQFFIKHFGWNLLWKWTLFWFLSSFSLIFLFTSRYLTIKLSDNMFYIWRFDVC